MTVRDLRDVADEAFFSRSWDHAGVGDDSWIDDNFDNLNGASNVL